MSTATLTRANRALTQAAAEASLIAEMQEALHSAPATIVRTPGFGGMRMTAAEVVNDSFAGESGDADLHEAVAILGAAARGEDVQLRASVWVRRQAVQHGQFHAADLVERGRRQA